MNKQEAIEKTYTASWDDLNYKGLIIDVETVNKIIYQIAEPKKVVVPKFVGEWLEWCKTNDVTLLGAISPIDELGSAICNDKRVKSLAASRWAIRNQDTFARAWLDGYEVEKEKQWVVKDDTGYLSYLQFSIPNIYQRETSLDKNDAYKFKSKSKADLFADLVAGTVEEVTDETE